MTFLRYTHTNNLLFLQTLKKNYSDTNQHTILQPKTKSTHRKR